MMHFTGNYRYNGPLTRCVKFRVAYVPGMTGKFSRHRLQQKPLVSDPSIHHGTCVTHMPWCILGSLTRGGEEAFPVFPAHAQPAILIVWQEDHGNIWTIGYVSISVFSVFVSRCRGQKQIFRIIINELEIYTFAVNWNRKPSITLARKNPYLRYNDGMWKKKHFNCRIQCLIQWLFWQTTNWMWSFP